jgi:hypothetical protein
VIAWRRAIAPGGIGQGSAFMLSPGSFKPAYPGARIRLGPDRGPDRAMRVRYRRS